MERLILDTFGRGLNTSENSTLLKPGEARVSRNLLHDYGDNRAKLRSGIDRQFPTRWSANPVYGLYYYVNNSGTGFNLAQVNGDLRTFSTSTSSSIDTGHQTTGVSRFAQALGFWLEADARDNNYIGSGTAGYPFQIAAPSIAFTATAVADATAADIGSSLLSVGTYYYDYARYSTVTTEISPARGTQVSVTTTAGNQRVTLNASAIAATEQFDRIRIYRTKAGGTQYYELADVTPANFDSGQTDGTPDASLVTISTIHTAAGASNTDRPAAATDIVFHRGRIHVIGLSGARSRHRWSQLNSYSFNSTTTARHDVESDDGDNLYRGFSFDGGLVLFKDHSIHLMNGDVDELSFTWQVASNRDAGVGAYCPFTAVATPIGIIFQGECGIYVFRPGMSRPQIISGSIQSTLEDLDYAYRLLFVGGYDPCLRAYLLSVTPSGQTENTITLVYFIDTGHWGEFRYGMGNIRPSVWAQITNSSSRQKAYFGETEGYVYETETSNDSDGVSSGTESGTVTSGSSTTLTDSTAAFRTTGDGIRDLSATIQTGTGTYETQEISSNTATELTTASWTTTPASQSYWVGAIEGILSLGRLDCGTAGYKRFVRLSFEFQSQSHSIPLLLGYTIDGDTEPTTVESVTQTGIFRASTIVNRIAVGLSPYIRIVGNNQGFEILKIEVDFHNLGGRLPRS